MSADTLVLAYRRPLCWHVDGDNFLHVDGNYLFLHVDGDNLFLHVDRNNLFCMSTETILFGMSTGTIFLACRRRQSPLACRREHFCMSTETIFFACGRRQQFFLHVDRDNLLLACRRGQPFWHVDSLACRRVVSRQSNFFPFQGLQPPISGVFILARWPCLTCTTATVKNKYYTTELDMYV